MENRVPAEIIRVLLDFQARRRLDRALKTLLTLRGALVLLSNADSFLAGEVSELRLTLLVLVLMGLPAAFAAGKRRRRALPADQKLRLAAELEVANFVILSGCFLVALYLAALSSGVLPPASLESGLSWVCANLPLTTLALYFSARWLTRRLAPRRLE
jgi:hypothetical protein